MSVRSRKTRGVSWAVVRRIFLALPGVEESTSYGTPSFRVRKRGLARLHEDGENLVVRVGLEERETLMAVDPHTFHITDHYVGHPYLLVRLESVHREDLRRIARQAWQSSVPKRLSSGRSA